MNHFSIFLLQLNNRIIDFHRDILKKKTIKQNAMIQSKNHFEIEHHFDLSKKNEMIEKIALMIEKIDYFHRFLTLLKGKYYDFFFPDVHFLKHYLNIYIKIMSKNDGLSDEILKYKFIVQSLKEGVDDEIISLIVSKIDDIFQELVFGMIFFSFDNLNELIYFFIKKNDFFISQEEESEFVKKKYVIQYDGNHVKDNISNLMKFGCCYLPFFYENFKDFQKLDTGRMMMDQKVIEKSIETLNHDHEFQERCDMLLKNTDGAIEYHGFLNDFIFFDGETFFSIFSYFATIMDFKIDEITRRFYSLKIDKFNKMIEMKSEIKHIKSMPELNVIQMNLRIHFYALRYNDVHILNTFQVNQFLNDKECNFIFNNFRSNGQFCVELPKNRFKSKSKKKMNVIHNIDQFENIFMSVELDNDSIHGMESINNMIVFKNENTGDVYFFKPLKRCQLTKDQLMILNEDIDRQYDQHDFELNKSYYTNMIVQKYDNEKDKYNFIFDGLLNMNDDVYCGKSKLFFQISLMKNLEQNFLVFMIEKISLLITNKKNIF